MGGREARCGCWEVAMTAVLSRCVPLAPLFACHPVSFVYNINLNSGEHQNVSETFAMPSSQQTVDLAYDRFPPLSLMISCEATAKVRETCCLPLFGSRICLMMSLSFLGNFFALPLL